MTRRCFVCAPESCMCDEVRPIEILRPSEWLRTLAHNLTIAGALCRAYDLGEIGIDVGPGVRFELPSGGIAWMPDAIWRPGCGKPAP